MCSLPLSRCFSPCALLSVLTCSVNVGGIVFVPGKVGLSSFFLNVSSCFSLCLTFLLAVSRSQVEVHCGCRVCHLLFLVGCPCLGLLLFYCFLLLSLALPVNVNSSSLFSLRSCCRELVVTYFRFDWIHSVLNFGAHILGDSPLHNSLGLGEILALFAQSC